MLFTIMCYIHSNNDQAFCATFYLGLYLYYLNGEAKFIECVCFFGTISVTIV